MTRKHDETPRNLLDRIIWFCLDNPLIVGIGLILFLGWGILVAPFDWKLDQLPRDPVPVDAIPDIGENQQIVFTQWTGQSPQDLEDQVTYPLTTALLGLPQVRTVRSFSFFGFSTIYVIFEEDAEFYWSRSRILEKLNSLPEGLLPPEVQPMLGPDATALGQVFWYTLEGRDPDGNVTGGWDLDELRTVQDWIVRYALLSVPGVSEVASVGGYVREYQVDVDPDAMSAYGISLNQVFDAVRQANRDVGARNIEINNVEYFVRGLGQIDDLEDLANAVVATRENVPIFIDDIATVRLGPAQRRGALDKEGAETVGGVVVARYGENPLAVIKQVKAKIDEISTGLPKKNLVDGSVSQIRIVPFYDRSTLIKETLGTLNTALSQEVIVTILVILVMLMHLRSALIVSGLLPGAVLLTFVAMKQFGVDANIVALSGIAIAIGTMVDMGVVLIENINRRLASATEKVAPIELIFSATKEVAGAVLTGVATTVVSFLPVFAMEAAEGKLFRPLAFTKTFALLASIVLSITVLPVLARFLLRQKNPSIAHRFGWLKDGAVIAAGIAAAVWTSPLLGGVLFGWGVIALVCRLLGDPWRRGSRYAVHVAVMIAIAWFLTTDWMPLGPEHGMLRNATFVILLFAPIMAAFSAFRMVYPSILAWALRWKAWVLTLPAALIAFGLTVWLGFNHLFGFLPESIQKTWPLGAVSRHFPGLGREFMPPLDEGSYLYMPTTSAHASIDEALDVMRKQDMRFNQIAEVETAVGKLGRVESSLDPAPISMIETVINIKSEFLLTPSGKRETFAFDEAGEDFFRDAQGRPLPAPDGQPYRVQGKFQRDEAGNLIADPGGAPFRQWRIPLDPNLNEGRESWQGIRRPDDIWDEIVRAGQIPGTTSAPKLQPIAARIVMLQSGMRAPMGVKVKGPTLKAVERAGLEIERVLREVPSIDSDTVVADRIVGKPYLEIQLDRKAIGRYGITLADVQHVIEVAIGGKTVTTTIEGRQRHQVRIRYPRELRDTPENLQRVLVPTAQGHHVPLGQMASIAFVRGPQVIKGEDTFLVGYVIFDKKADQAEVEVVEEAAAFLKDRMASGALELGDGVSFTFSGSYENQVRASKRLAVVLPLALVLIVLILYLNFRSLTATALVFSGIFVAWAGGFALIWCYAQPGFLDFSLFGTSMRDLFQVHPINLSVAVWVGFLALFGIATDDGVLMSTMLDQTFGKEKPDSVEAVRVAVVQAASLRIRPAMMTSATTIMALIPVLSAQGRGADILVPMAIPTFGGMCAAMITVFVVPILYCWIEERRLKKKR